MEYTTKDFYRASLLKALKVPLLRLERGNRDFADFVFQISKGQADSIFTDYWNHNLSIQAKDLIDAINDMKSILYSK